MRVENGHFVWEWYDAADAHRTPVENAGLLFVAYVKKFKRLRCEGERTFLKLVAPKLVDAAMQTQKLTIADVECMIRAVVERESEYALDEFFGVMFELLAAEEIFASWRPGPAEFNPFEPWTGQTRKTGSHRSPN
jgi:hypothetical protein